MVKNNIILPIKRKDLPEGVKPIDSTWACKKKSNGKLRGRLNARGFKQKEGQDYIEESIHAPVTQKTTVFVTLVLGEMNGWRRRCIDVSGAFLKEEFEDGEEIYMEVPRGWEKFYGKEVVLKLLATIYGLKQSAMAFWRELVRCMQDMKMKRSSANPCSHYRWDNRRLILVTSWIDNKFITGETELAKETENELQERFECTDKG